jgi:leucyl aminopeptidase
MPIQFKSINNPATVKTGCLIVPYFSDLSFGTQGQILDKTLKKLLSTLLKNEQGNKEAGSTIWLPFIDGINSQRVLLVNFADKKSLNSSQYQKAIEAICKTLVSHKIADAVFIDWEQTITQKSSTSSVDYGAEWQIQQLALTQVYSTYRYTATKGKTDKSASREKSVKPAVITLSANSKAGYENAAKRGAAIGAGMNTTRELGNLPPNICTPTYLANEVKNLAKGQRKVSVTVLNEAQMKKLGMGAFLAVSTGSDEPAKIIALEYKGGNSKDAPIALVGKGITFDSGGISIKPSAKMDEMKYDMCGAASVIGTLQMVIELKLPLNIVGIIAAAENLPSGKATKPGDIVKSLSGQTIEILNTDAEGRLVLCDALTWAKKFKPKTVIDIATLTGACVVALGKHATGLFSNDGDLANELIAAGECIGDRAWQMPLWDEYQKQLESPFADIANVGGPEGGAITAACFLSRFTKDYRWAHLDIAGSAWNSAPKGGTGRPVALLSQYLINCCS